MTNHDLHASVHRDGEALTIRLTGSLAKTVDAKMLEACVQSLASCASANQCLSGRVSLSDKCIGTIARHDAEIKCISQSFGFGKAR